MAGPFSWSLVLSSGSHKRSHFPGYQLRSRFGFPVCTVKPLYEALQTILWRLDREHESCFLMDPEDAGGRYCVGGNATPRNRAGRAVCAVSSYSLPLLWYTTESPLHGLMVGPAWPDILVKHRRPSPRGGLPTVSVIFFSLQRQRRQIWCLAV